MHELTVFIGYQFRSSIMSRTTLLSMVIEAMERLEADINKVYPDSLRLDLQPLDLLSAKPLGTQVLRAVDQASICVFELSELNRNVLFEMGYAEGKGKPSIYLVHETLNLDDLPSDIKGDYVEQYREDRLDIKLGRQLKLVLESMFPDLSVG